MPQIIENLRGKLLKEAKKQIEKNGYARTTIRSIARACGVGIGTVYNYYPSKDMLIASFVAEDWKGCLEEMKNADAADCRAFIEHVHGCLTGFIKRNKTLFSDRDAAGSFGAAFFSRHAQMRDQIADAIRPACEAAGCEGEFFAQFSAESLLSWTSAGKSFEDQWSVMKRLFI